MTTARFKDRDGQEWSLEIDFPILSKIQKELDVNLLSEDGLTKLSRFEDPVEDFTRVASILYLICQDQAEQLGVSDEQFGSNVGKATIFVEAVRALNEALAAFYRGVGMTPLATLIERTMSLKPELTKRVNEKVSATTIDRLLMKSMDVFETQLDEALSSGENELDQLIHGNEPTNSPPSSESPTLNIVRD